MSLNYKHLKYFQAVAHMGNLTRAAEQLFVSQSALSVQIRKLEEWLGHELFERQGKRLVLTEAGRIALQHADAIFSVGDELIGTLREQDTATQRVLRIGALSTLSRNFQSRFLEPLFEMQHLLVVIRSGDQSNLLDSLEKHDCDVVLTNIAPSRDSGRRWIVNPIAEQAVSLIGNPQRLDGDASLESLLSEHPLIVPTMENSIRISFDALCDRLDIQPTIRAEVDDMALIRILARADMGLAVIPPIVVRDELDSGRLREFAQLGDFTETFYAITVKRNFPNPVLQALVRQLGQ
ncbi:MAG: LysR family transcriptional regulator [Pseudomonadota bacterium]